MRRLLVLIAGCAAVLAGLAATWPAPRHTTACVPRWHAVAQGAKVPSLGDVSALSATDVWAVGSTGEQGKKSFRAVVAHWDGHGLNVTSPFGSSPDYELSAVAAVAPDDVWAVGDRSLERPVIAHWDGQAWQVVPAPSLGGKAWLRGILALDDDDLWAAGALSLSRLRDVPLVLRWDGRRWRAVDMGRVEPAGQMGSDLAAIDGSSANDVWAVGGGAGDPHLAQTLVLHWNGRSWKELDFKDPKRSVFSETLIAVDVRSPRDVWALGSTFLEGFEVHAVHWGGPSLGKVAGRFSQDLTRNDLAATSARSVWVVGSRGPFDRPRPLVTHWDGKTWTTQPTALDRLKNAGLNSLSVLSPTDIWAAGPRLLARYSCRSQLTQLRQPRAARRRRRCPARA